MNITDRLCESTGLEWTQYHGHWQALTSRTLYVMYEWKCGGRFTLVAAGRIAKAGTLDDVIEAVWRMEGRVLV